MEASTAGAARRVLILSTVAFTLLFAVWLMFGVLGVAIKREFALTPVRFAWLTASAILSGSLLRLPLGILTDRIGGRPALSALLLITAVPCALVAWAQSYAALLALALLFGVAGNSFSLGIAWNSAWFTRERQGVALGTFGAGNVGASLTKLIGPLLIGLVPVAGFAGGAVPGGWRFVPLLYAVLLVIMAGLVWRLAPAPDRRPGAGRPLAAMLAPLANLRVWRFGLYYVVVFGAYVALSLWLPNYYKEVYGLPLASAALLTTLFIFPASLLRPLGGWLSDRFGARPVTYATFIAMLLASVPLALPSSVLRLDVASFTALVVVLGVGMGVGKASVYRYIPDYFPGDVGAVGGLVGTLGALGGFVLPLSFGYLQQATGRPESCFMAVVALIALSLLWLHRVVIGIKRREREAIRLGVAPETA
jgi:NNP family nitrate/nitrite transporter-like MFS transporter